MPEADILTDAEIETLVSDQEQAKPDETEPEEKEEKKEKEETKESPPELTASDKEWAALGRELGSGVTPAQLVAFAKKGYEGEQVAAKGEAEKKDEPTKKGAKDTPSFITREEHVAALKDTERRISIQTAGVQAHARLSMLLDQAGLTDADDAIGRRMVSETAVRAIGNGAPLEAAFRGAVDEFNGWVAHKATKVLRDKVKARSATGSVGAGAAADPVKHEKMEHKSDDFDTGEAIKQAMRFVEEGNRTGLPPQ